MHDALVSLLSFGSMTKQTDGQGNLLAYPQHVIFECIDAILNNYCRLKGLILSVHVKLFYPLEVLQLQENIKDTKIAQNKMVKSKEVKYLDNHAKSNVQPIA